LALDFFCETFLSNTPTFKLNTVPVFYVNKSLSQVSEAYYHKLNVIAFPLEFELQRKTIFELFNLADREKLCE